MDYLKIYANFLKKFLKPKKKLRVVFDCSNGTTGLVLKKLKFKSGNLKTILINEKPDGNFPAHGPNPMAEGAMKDLQKSVLKNKADLGVIFDADGDRVFFVDDRGREIAVDIPIILLSENFRGPVALAIDIGLFSRELLAKNNKKIIDSRVGHYFIKKLIRGGKINFAAERSGHYYFKDFFYADSGILAAIRFINSVSGLPKSLSGWINTLPVYYQSGEINFVVRDKEGALKKVEAYYKSLAKKTSHLDGLVMELDSPTGGWWFSLRPSNTEDFLRLNLEARNQKSLNENLSAIKQLLKSTGNV